MKKIIYMLAVLAICCPIAFASHHSGPSHSGGHHSASHSHSHNPNHYHSSGSSSTPVYLIKKTVDTKEIKFPNCDMHYVISEITTDYYSDGSKRVFTNSTIYNKDGSVLVPDCQSVQHIIYENKHYFLIRKNRVYKILDEMGENLTVRNYSGMEEISPNRIKVRYDKKYGIIDLREKTIVPIKYQNLERYGNDIFVSKLNRYYGIIDAENNTLVENDCDRIKPAYDTFIIKRYNKYGLADMNGKLILNIQYDKIKKLGEYLLVRKNERYGVMDSSGKMISEIQYKKIKLERNHLMGQKFSGLWEEIKPEEL